MHNASRVDVTKTQQNLARFGREAAKFLLDYYWYSSGYNDP